MRCKLLSSFLVAAVLLLAGPGAVAQSPCKTPAPQTALGTGFSYQGQLRDAGGPVNGACDLQFGLWDAEPGGNPIGSTQTET